MFFATSVILNSSWPEVCRRLIGGTQPASLAPLGAGAEPLGGQLSFSMNNMNKCKEKGNEE